MCAHIRQGEGDERIFVFAVCVWRIWCMCGEGGQIICMHTFCIYVCIIGRDIEVHETKLCCNFPLETKRGERERVHVPLLPVPSKC